MDYSKVPHAHELGQLLDALLAGHEVADRIRR